MSAIAALRIVTLGIANDRSLKFWLEYFSSSFSLPRRLATGSRRLLTFFILAFDSPNMMMKLALGRIALIIKRKKHL